MGKARKTRKAGAVKRMLNPKDSRLLQNGKSCTAQEQDRLKCAIAKKGKLSQELVRHVAKAPVSMFFTHNKALVPPFQVIVDTNFINSSIQNKLELVREMMDCLLAKCTPCITDCVMAELEKLGLKYRLALRVAKDPRFKRLACSHKGTYADDCIVSRVTHHRCYIVATCDKDLKRRLRKIPGVPIMYLYGRKYSIERLPEATLNAPAF